MEKMPRARTSDLVFQELENELLVYDLKSHRTICFNETSRLIWRYCDGKAKTKDLISRHGLNDDLINLAVDEFQNYNLLKDRIETDVPADRLERRKFFAKLTETAAVTLPIIGTLAARQTGSAQNTCLPEDPPVI